MQRLEEKFRESNYLSSDEVMQLAMLLNLSETRVSKEAGAVLLSHVSRLRGAKCAMITSRFRSVICNAARKADVSER